MRARYVVCLTLLITAAALVLPGTAAAQTGGISGEVTDETGGVLPGVVVTATSPAQIDARTSVTDGEGRYTLVSLQPGDYVVEFTLPGFSTVRREGVELSSGFTANIDIQMVVGGVEETVTVTGATPTVDIQNVRTQAVLDDETLNLLPGAQSVSSFSMLTLGANVGGNTGGVDVGGTGGEMGVASVHANRGNDMKISQEGMNTNNSMGANGGIMHFGQHYNMEAVAEVTMSTNGMSAETETAGLQLNYIPKDGGNVFSSSGRANHTTEDFQSNNLSSDLEERGATTPGSVKKLYDYGFSVGGPIVRDRAWFFTAHRWWTAETYAPGAFYNALQGQKAPNGRPLYQADLDRRGFVADPNRENSARFTIQASSKDKLTYYGNLGNNCVCFRGTSSVTAPEAAQITRTDNNHLSQVTWTRAQSNSILLEGGFTYLKNPFIHAREDSVGRNDVRITELAPAQGFARNYNAFSLFAFIPYNEDDGGSATDQVNARGALSYVTGSHSFKFGGTWQHGWIVNNGSNNHIPGFGPAEIWTLFGNPVQVVLMGHPQFSRSDFQNVALYAQDQWTIDRFTVNLGVRGDFFTGWSPDQVVPDTPYTPGFTVERIEGTPSWNDVSPRLGLAWDLRGDGKTAVKVSLGRYVSGQGTGAPLAQNPATTIARLNFRGWNDANNDFFPDGDPSNPLANGELGPSTNPAFGTLGQTTFFDDDVVKRNRQGTWQFSAGVDQELRDNVRLSFTYFRTSHFNQTLSANEALTSDDFDPYCVTAPSDPQFPGGGSNEICGFYNISAEGLATPPENLTTLASNFGDRSEVYNGFDVETQARFDNGALIQGGFTLGENVNDSCFVVEDPQDLYQCRIVSPWWNGNGQIKFAGSYPLPYGIALSGSFQNIPGPEIRANVLFQNSQIAPSLGRNLSSCPAPTGPCTQTVTLDVFEERNSDFEGRINQLDFRVMKDFETDIGRFRVTFDLYNALNASPVLTRNQNYGTTGVGWGNVTQFMAGRLIKFGGQYNWN